MNHMILLSTLTIALNTFAMASHCPDIGIFKKALKENKNAIASGHSFSFKDSNGQTWRNINYYLKPVQGRSLSLDEALELQEFSWETAGDDACRGDSKGFTILIHKQ